MQIAVDVVVAKAMSVEKPSKLPVLLGDPPGCQLDLSRGLDTLELIDPQSLLELLEIFSPSSS